MPKHRIALETALDIVLITSPREIARNKLPWIDANHRLVQRVAELVQQAIDQSKPTIPNPEITPFAETHSTLEIDP